MQAPPQIDEAPGSEDLGGHEVESDHNQSNNDAGGSDSDHPSSSSSNSSSSSDSEDEILPMQVRCFFLALFVFFSSFLQLLLCVCGRTSLCLRTKTSRFTKAPTSRCCSTICSFVITFRDSTLHVRRRAPSCDCCGSTLLTITTSASPASTCLNTFSGTGVRRTPACTSTAAPAIIISLLRRS